MKRFCECRQAMVHDIGACVGCDDGPERETRAFMDVRGDTTCPEDIPADVWDIALRDAIEAVGITKPIAEIVAQAIVAERERCAGYHDKKAVEHEGLRFDAKGDLTERHAKMVRFHQASATAIRKGGAS